MIVEQKSLKELDDPKALFFFTEKHYGEFLDKIEKEIVLAYCAELPSVLIRLCTVVYKGYGGYSINRKALRDDISLYGSLLIMRYLYEKGYGVSLRDDKDHICLSIDIAGRGNLDADALFAKYLVAHKALKESLNVKEPSIWDKIKGFFS